METFDYTGNIAGAAEVLKNGGLVAVPTETVYGLAANGLDAQAVEKIYELKGRPEGKPISLMVPDAAAIDDLCMDVPRSARQLADFFWPGPLTIILKAKETVPEIVRGGGDTVGLRCPKHGATLELLRQLPFPLAVPSANPSGEKSPTALGEVLEYFGGQIEGVIDGGECALALESTVIDMSQKPFRILRQGAASEYEIDMALMSGLTIIGITGGTGCGKTTALTTLRDMGGLVIDSDHVYHELLRESEDLRREIDKRFPGALPKGSVNTKDLGKIVFSDEKALRDLNSITHRFVGEEIMRRLTDWAKNGGEVAAIDAIALFEGGVNNICRATVGITAPTQTRIERLMRREGISAEYAKLRIDAQKTNEYFESVCDYALCNDSTMEDFSRECRRVFSEIIKDSNNLK